MMPDNKEKDLPLFSDDLPKEPEKEPAEIPVAVPSSPAAPLDDKAADAPLIAPTIDETYSAAKDIFEAIHRKDMVAVLSFLEKKSNLAVTDESERTPLQIAAGIGVLEIVKLLVECGANIEAKGKDGRTPLMLALSDGHFEVADYLLSKGANVNVASASNYTPLMQAAAKGATELLRNMLPKIDNVNLKNNDGRTALMIAIRFGHRDVIEMLLARNASLQITDVHGNTAVALAETPDLKKYLSEKLEEEKKHIEEGKKDKEETITEEVKKHYPSIFLLIGMIILASAAGYFAYYQLQKTKIRQIVIPTAMQQPSEMIAKAYCSRLAECREGISADFVKRCIELSSPRFGEFLADQKGDKCDQNRVTTCTTCLLGLTCDRTKKLDFDYLENNCKSCFKACLPAQ
jgi:hypothetical protein